MEKIGTRRVGNWRGEVKSSSEVKITTLGRKSVPSSRGTTAAGPKRKHLLWALRPGALGKKMPREPDN